MPKTCLWLDKATCFCAGPDGNEAVLVRAGRGGRGGGGEQGSAGRGSGTRLSSHLTLTNPFPHTSSPHALRTPRARPSTPLERICLHAR